jgi:ribosomal protein S18 acetylase RimI-like enzyme
MDCLVYPVSLDYIQGCQLRSSPPDCTMNREPFAHPEMLPIEVIVADLGRPEHRQAVLNLIDAYAADPMGNGKPLADEVRCSLISGLRKHPTTIIFLAYQNKTAVGIAVRFTGFSTFAAHPLVNIHDFAVLPAFRGRGIGRKLLAEIARRAKEMGCCKLTSEVQENNHRARQVYEAAGFAQAQYEKAAGLSLFYSKPL